VAIDTVASAKAEGFYWLTIMFSQTLAPHSATGRPIPRAWLQRRCAAVRRPAGPDCGGLPLDFALAHAAVLGGLRAHAPAGAVLGDFLDKPLASGGLALSRYSASAVLLVFIVAAILIFPQKAARRGH